MFICYGVPNCAQALKLSLSVYVSLQRGMVLGSSVFVTPVLGYVTDLLT